MALSISDKSSGPSARINLSSPCCEIPASSSPSCSASSSSRIDASCLDFAFSAGCTGCACRFAIVLHVASQQQEVCATQGSMEKCPLAMSIGDTRQLKQCTRKKKGPLAFSSRSSSPLHKVRALSPVPTRHCLLGLPCIPRQIRSFHPTSSPLSQIGKNCYQKLMYTTCTYPWRSCLSLMPFE